MHLIVIISSNGIICKDFAALNVNARTSNSVCAMWKAVHTCTHTHTYIRVYNILLFLHKLLGPQNYSAHKQRMQTAAQIKRHHQCRIKVGAIDAAALGPLLKIGPPS